MRILFVADGRSPTALSWISYFVDKHEVHLVSTFACQPPVGLASFNFVPVAFSSAVNKDSPAGRQLRAGFSSSARNAIRNLLGPFTIAPATREFKRILAVVQPDLVHALRIPYEGMLAAAADPPAPLLISVWGNDFTLHARSNPLMAAATRRALQRADALHTDTHRDQRLAQDWGFAANKPTIVLPGNGGVRSDLFHPPAQPAQELLVINPRGIRSYVRNDVFFQAIPLVLQAQPNVQFDCPAMLGEPEAEYWVGKLELQSQVNLQPKFNTNDLAAAYRRAQVMVSPSTHDGTPNSLLEAMASGCFPICGDLDSIREWITDGENGLIVDPTNPRALADGILAALRNSNLRQQAAQLNSKLITDRADYRRNMSKAEAFYSTVSNVSV